MYKPSNRKKTNAFRLNIWFTQSCRNFNCVVIYALFLPKLFIPSLTAVFLLDYTNSITGVPPAGCQQLGEVKSVWFTLCCQWGVPYSWRTSPVQGEGTPIWAILSIFLLDYNIPSVAPVMGHPGATDFSRGKIVRNVCGDSLIVTLKIAILHPVVIDYGLDSQKYFYHNFMTAADSAVVLLELDIQWDLAGTH